MDYTEIAAGTRFTVLAIREVTGEAGQVETFVAGLPHADQRKVFDRVWLAANYGPLSNPTQSKALAGTEGLFELKCGGCRLSFFYWGRGAMVLTHGFTKRTPRTPRQELKRGERLRWEFLSTFGSGERGRAR